MQIKYVGNDALNGGLPPIKQRFVTHDEQANQQQVRLLKLFR